MKKLYSILGLITVPTLAIGGIDANRLEEVPIERVEMIKGERVETKQIGNVLETTLSWKGQPGLKVKYDMGEPSPREKLLDKRDRQAVTEVLNDSFKIDIVLNERPGTNVFCQQFEGHEDYNFYSSRTYTKKQT